MMLLVCPAGSSGAQDATPGWLSGLNKTVPSSLCRARERFRSQFRQGSPEQTQHFFELWHWYEESVRANQESIEGRLTDGLPAGTGDQVIEALSVRKPDLIPDPVRQRMMAWTSCGYRIETELATIILDQDPYFLRDEAAHVQPELRDYVNLFLKESPNRIEYDGGLAIHPDQLRSRIGRWERFEQAHRNVIPLVRDMNERLQYMFEEYLCGAPNSPVFDDKGEVEPYLRASYKQFLRINTESRRYQLVAHAVQIFERHGWKRNAELIALYRANRLNTEMLEPH